ERVLLEMPVRAASSWRVMPRSSRRRRRRGPTSARTVARSVMSEVHQAFPEMATRDCGSRDVDGSWSKEVIEMDSNYDVVIVGGGAAGLSGALVLGRARRRVVVID